MRAIAEDWLRKVTLSPDLPDLPSSQGAFEDGGSFRIEIPEVENPQVFQVMLEAANNYGIRIHRVSQGTGITRLMERDLQKMAQLGYENDIEVYLFIGIRGDTGLSVQARSQAGGSTKKRIQGATQFAYALEDVYRALEAGIRGFLISDEGLMSVLRDLRAMGEIPSDVAIKTSVSMGYGNPASARVLETLGANSFNLPVDVSLGTLAAIRKAVRIPLDIYIEAPASLGGDVRLYELPDIVRIASPVNLKFGLSTEETTDPIGVHTQHTADLQVKERVRLAALGLEILSRNGLASEMSPFTKGRLGVPAFQRVATQ